MPVSNATLLAKISALEQRVNKLSAQVKADETKLHPLLIANNITYLAGLGQMGFLGQLDQDPNSGNYWVTGERNDYINTPIAKINLMLTRMINQGLMAAS